MDIATIIGLVSSFTLIILGMGDVSSLRIGDSITTQKGHIVSWAISAQKAL